MSEVLAVLFGTVACGGFNFVFGWSVNRLVTIM
jgi:hypothetical protein